MAGEHLRRARVGEPAAIAGAVARQHRERLARVAHAVDVERQAGASRRLQQKLFELRGALAVAPVADPDQPIARLSCAGGWNSATSAASCQTKTRSPQPQRR